MASPVALGAMGLQAAGSVVGAMGAQYQGNAQANMYNYQAGLAVQNSILAKQDSNYTLSAGEVEEQQLGMKTRAQIGATRAGFGASNVDVNTGSSSRVTSSETEIGQEEESVSQANTLKKAYGFSVKSAQDVAQSNVYSTAAQTSKESGNINALSTIIGGASGVASKWMQYSTNFGSPSGGYGG